jgi:urea transport system ATP-binding protein
LTPRETEAAAQTLRRLAADRGLTVVAVEHDMGFVRSFSESVTVLHRGTVLAGGTVEEMQANEDVRSAYLGVGT